MFEKKFMSIPIFFVHKGNSPYLKYTLNQAKALNKNNRVILLGDNSNRCYSKIEHHSISDYSKFASNFEQNYIHMSYTPYAFELICFLRWFIIYEFVDKQNIDGAFLCLDSDVMLYCNTTEVEKQYNNTDLTIRNNAGAGFNFFKNKLVLKSFCDFMLKQYTKEKELDRLKANWQGFEKIKQGGICDMMMFQFFREEKTDLRIGNPGKIENNIMFEHVISEDKNFEKEYDNISKIYFKHKKPYAIDKTTKQFILLKSIHCHAMNRSWIFRYYSGKKFKAYYQDWFRYTKHKLKNKF